MHLKWWAPFAAAAVMMLITMPCIFAQSAQANLNGTITDTSGNGIPSATVRLVRQETMWTRSTETGASGVYSLPDLPIGTYEITVSRPDFNDAHVRSVELLIAQTRTL